MALTSAIVAPIAMILIRKIIAADAGWDSVGHWQAVWKISDVYLSVITISLTTYYLPRLSAISNSKLIEREVIKTLMIVIPIVSFMALGIYFFRDLIITLLYTEDFKNARELFAIQLVGDVVKIVSWLIAFPMISKGRTKLYIFTEIIFSSTLVLWTFYFVKNYGVQGANMAYLTNFSIYLIFICFKFKGIISDTK
jgi:PST family polysaccharide transporter